MKRDNKLKKLRVDFVKLAMNNPKAASKKLKDLSFSLGETKTSKDTIYALTQIFGVSEKTIIRDFLNDTL